MRHPPRRPRHSTPAPGPGRPTARLELPGVGADVGNRSPAPTSNHEAGRQAEHGGDPGGASILGWSPGAASIARFRRLRRAPCSRSPSTPGTSIDALPPVSSAPTCARSSVPASRSGRPTGSPSTASLRHRRQQVAFTLSTGLTGAGVQRPVAVPPGRPGVAGRRRLQHHGAARPAPPRCAPSGFAPELVPEPGTSSGTTPSASGRPRPAGSGHVPGPPSRWHRGGHRRCPGVRRRQAIPTGFSLRVTRQGGHAVAAARRAGRPSRGEVQKKRRPRWAPHDRRLSVPAESAGTLSVTLGSCGRGHDPRRALLSRVCGRRSTGSGHDRPDTPAVGHLDHVAAVAVEHPPPGLERHTQEFALRRAVRWAGGSAAGPASPTNQFGCASGAEGRVLRPAAGTATSCPLPRPPAAEPASTSALQGGRHPRSPSALRHRGRLPLGPASQPSAFRGGWRRSTCTPKAIARVVVQQLAEESHDEGGRRPPEADAAESGCEADPRCCTDHDRRLARRLRLLFEDGAHSGGEVARGHGGAAAASRPTVSTGLPKPVCRTWRGQGADRLRLVRPRAGRRAGPASAGRPPRCGSPPPGLTDDPAARPERRPPRRRRLHRGAPGPTPPESRLVILPAEDRCCARGPSFFPSLPVARPVRAWSGEDGDRRQRATSGSSGIGGAAGLRWWASPPASGARRRPGPAPSQISRGHPAGRRPAARWSPARRRGQPGSRDHADPPG